MCTCHSNGPHAPLCKPRIAPASAIAPIGHLSIGWSARAPPIARSTDYTEDGDSGSNFRAGSAMIST